MNEMENYVAIAIIAFLSGAILGALIYRIFTTSAGKSKEMEQQIDDLQQKHTQYQTQVSEHFIQTAHLINRLNEDYREIHSHLAQGATELCSEDSAHNLLNLSSDEDQGATLEAEQEILELEESYAEPPRDYAPKSNKDQGTLSEDFGLKEKDKTVSE